MKPKAQAKITRMRTRSMNGGIMISFAVVFQKHFLLSMLETLARFPARSQEKDHPGTHAPMCRDVNAKTCEPLRSPNEDVLRAPFHTRVLVHEKK
jgi:hypothetical protein